MLASFTGNQQGLGSLSKAEASTTYMLVSSRLFHSSLNVGCQCGSGRFFNFYVFCSIKKFEKGLDIFTPNRLYKFLSLIFI